MLYRDLKGRESVNDFSDKYSSTRLKFDIVNFMDKNQPAITEGKDLEIEMKLSK